MYLIPIVFHEKWKEEGEHGEINQHHPFLIHVPFVGPSIIVCKTAIRQRLYHRSYHNAASTGNLRYCRIQTNWR